VREIDPLEEPEPGGAVAVGLMIWAFMMVLGICIGLVVGCVPAQGAEAAINRSGYGFGLTLEQDLELRRIHKRLLVKRAADRLLDCIESAEGADKLSDCTAIDYESAPERAITEETR
jgi:hypothetical protein